MIYTASYFQSQFHHGELISISRSNPKGFKSIGKLSIFVPDSREIKALGKQDQDPAFESSYVDLYRHLCSQRLDAIHRWLNSLDPNCDQTLLCWERKGDFCHRNLAIKFVQKFRSDCYGGMDI